MPKDISWKQNLLNRSPKIVLIVGYLFCGCIFLSAGFTWFVKTDIQVSAKCRFLPHLSNVFASKQTVVLNYLYQSGKKIELGDKIADIIVDSTSIINWTLREYLDLALSEISVVTEELSGKSKNRAIEMLSVIPKDLKSESFHSPSDGWFFVPIKSGNHLNSTHHSIKKGELICQIANLQSATLEVNFVPKGQVTVSRNDSIEIRIPEYESVYLNAIVDQLRIKADIIIQNENNKLLNADNYEDTFMSQIEIAGMETKATISNEEKLFRIHIEITDWKSAQLLPTNGREVNLIIQKLGSHALKGLWSDVHAVVISHMKQSDIPKKITENLLRNLDKGIGFLEVENCWARIGEERLFVKLFRK